MATPSLPHILDYEQQRVTLYLAKEVQFQTKSVFKWQIDILRLLAELIPFLLPRIRKSQLVIKPVPLSFQTIDYVNKILYPVYSSDTKAYTRFVQIFRKWFKSLCYRNEFSDMLLICKYLYKSNQKKKVFIIYQKMQVLSYNPLQIQVLSLTNSVSLVYIPINKTNKTKG